MKNHASSLEEGYDKTVIEKSLVISISYAGRTESKIWLSDVGLRYERSYLECNLVHKVLQHSYTVGCV